MSKLTLQALALTGILAVSGLPAFAADMIPASPAVPAVNGSVSTGTSAQVKTGTTAAKSTTDKTKMSAAKKTDKIKKTATDSKDKANAVHQQTAQKPAASVGVNGAAGVTTPAPAVNGSVGASVH